VNARQPINMQALTLNCPNCGAAISSDAPQCRYCESKLATISCPSCFGMMFMGSKFCQHCGATPTKAKAADLSILKCPRCKIDMTSMTLGTEAMRECEKCGGLWVEVAALERVCANREEQSAVLGGATPLPPQGQSDGGRVSYVPCPQCSNLMNRINFARCSGVIVDVCRGHGTWFDRDELSQIVQFIRGGGLELSRQREKRELEHERDQLRADNFAASERSGPFERFAASDERLGGLSATHELLKFLIDP
jgi:Zn-finger nucleic acid-binding protein